MWQTIHALNLTGASSGATELESVLKPDHAVRVFATATDAIARTGRRNGGASAWKENSAPAVFIIIASQQTDASNLMQAVDQVKAAVDDVPLLLITPEREAGDLIELLRRGVDDFVTLPVATGSLKARLAHLSERYAKADPAVSALKCVLGLKQIVGESPAFLAAIRHIPLFARCDANVLIDGETGTGKEICARAIHYLSRRASGPFIPINCGAIPAELLENELFGHKRAAYTGAFTAQEGLVAEGEGGTLFLDEVDAISPAAQVKLLRLLQEREYRPLGSLKLRRANVRFIAATNAVLEEGIKSGRVREDFFYRISTLQIRLPPLRARGEDVVLLTKHLLARFAGEYGIAVPKFARAATHALLQYHWPGNVRELEHVIERAVILAQDRSTIDLSDLQLPQAIPEEAALTFRNAKRSVVARFEASYIRSMLAAHHGNVTHAAIAAGKNPRAFRQLIRKHKVNAREYRSLQG